MQVLKQRFASQVLRAQRADRARAQGWLWDGMLEEGHVWKRRFYDFVVCSEPKRVEKVRYMHRNPVKRGQCVFGAKKWHTSFQHAVKQ